MKVVQISSLNESRLMFAGHGAQSEIQPFQVRRFVIILSSMALVTTLSSRAVGNVCDEHRNLRLIWHSPFIMCCWSRCTRTSSCQGRVDNAADEKRELNVALNDLEVIRKEVAMNAKTLEDKDKECETREKTLWNLEVNERLRGSMTARSFVANKGSWKFKTLYLGLV